METKWIDEKEASKIIGVAVQTLRNWRFRQAGPPYSKVGRMVRYSLADLIQFMTSKKIDITQ